MSVRRWQVPASVAAAAASAEFTSPLENARHRDIAARMSVTSDTLLALTASVEAPNQVSEWARTVYRQALAAESAAVSDTLVAAGFDPTGCTPDAYAILDPRFDGERICAVVRASADGYERWGTDGWETSPAPEGMPYLELRGDALADALTAAASGVSLLLRPTQPRAFIASREPGALVAAVNLAKPVKPAPPTQPAPPAPPAPVANAASATDEPEAASLPDAPSDGAASPVPAGDPSSNAAPAADDGPPSHVYAITDPFDTTAVITLFQALPGPEISVRKAGGWVPDDGTLLGQLKSINPPPVVSVPSSQVDSVLRQVDDFDSTHPAAAAAPGGGSVVKTPGPDQGPQPVAASAASADAGPRVAGLCVRAADTGRVFMIQRSLDPDDPADVRGTWEFPGGHLEDGDQSVAAGAQREWEEETGHPLPDGPLDPTGTWDSPNGLYRGHVHDVPSEDAIDITDRDSFTNPDDPDGDRVEAVAWWDPNLIAGNPAIRPELRHTAHLVHAALDPASAPLAASAHKDAVRAAQNTDSAFDAERAAADSIEQKRRHEFEGTIAHRHAALVAEGTTSPEAAGAVAREIRAEDARRELWEKDRIESLASEKERRLRMHPELRDSAAEEEAAAAAEAEAATKAAAEPVPVVADAVAHTAMPDPLERYWTKGAGAAKVRWGAPGDYNRCREELAKYLHPEQINGACNELHKLATGIWPATHAKLDRKLVNA